MPDMSELTKYMGSLKYVKCEWLKKLPGWSNPSVGTIQDIDEEGAKMLEAEGYVKIL